MDDKDLIAELQNALSAALEFIDAIPLDVVNSLPTMPGFDRDWADSLLTHQETDV